MKETLDSLVQISKTVGEIFDFNTTFILAFVVKLKLVESILIFSLNSC